MMRRDCRMSGQSNNAKAAFVGRVVQLDANTLDDELVTLLISQLKEAFHYLPMNLLATVQPEVQLILELIKGQALVESAATIGQRLFGLSLVFDSPRTRWLYLLLSALPGWLNTRVSLVLSLLTNRRLNECRIDQMRRCIMAIEYVVRALSLVNTMVFLRRGVYATLLCRVLAARVVTDATVPAMHTDYTCLCRQFLWRGMAELLLCVRPLFNWQRARFYLASLVSSVRRRSPAPLLTPCASFVSSTLCAGCQMRPCLPYIFDCGHVACYSCVAASLSQDGGKDDDVMCPQCFHITTQQRLSLAPCVG